jgi:hypothetical protein
MCVCGIILLIRLVCYPPPSLSLLMFKDFENDMKANGLSIDTVKPYTWNTCDPGTRHYRDAVIYKSPNKANRGGKFYCVLGDSCRAQGDAYWDDSGCAGGP